MLQTLMGNSENYADDTVYDEYDSLYTKQLVRPSEVAFMKNPLSCEGHCSQIPVIMNTTLTVQASTAGQGSLVFKTGGT